MQYFLLFGVDVAVLQDCLDCEDVRHTARLPAFTGTCGSTPVPSQLVLLIGFSARAKGRLIPK